MVLSTVILALCIVVVVMKKKFAKKSHPTKMIDDEEGIALRRYLMEFG